MEVKKYITYIYRDRTGEIQKYAEKETEWKQRKHTGKKKRNKRQEHRDRRISRITQKEKGKKKETTNRITKTGKLKKRHRQTR